jgi:D-aminopeptidase
MQPGPKNLITDVAGLVVGNAEDEVIKTGTTVLTATTPFTAAVDVMGGAPGTRETDCLDPDRLVSDVDALVLSGGSAFGLDAASGVVDALADEGRGFAVGSVTVPIVPAAILFDLLNGGDKDWGSNPYRRLGAEAYANTGVDFALGTAGAGFGATTANLKGGLGSASLVLDDGCTVGALVAVNPHGSAVVPGSGNFWAAPFEVNAEFGGRGQATEFNPLGEPQNEKQAAFEDRANTTIAIVATDAVLDKAQLKRVAVAAQDGMARALVPAHTPFDGDLVFSLATGTHELEDPVRDLMTIGHAASICLSRAIARGVFEATARPQDTLATWADTWGSGPES